MHVRTRAVLAAAAALAVATVAIPAQADAATTFSFTGSNTQTLVFGDTGLLYADGCDHGDFAIDEDDPTACFPDGFPGTIWMRAVAGVNTTVLTAQQAAFVLDSPETIRQDADGTVYTTLDATDAAGHEVVVKTEPWIEVDAAYDAPLANCPKSTITSIGQLEAADTSGCLNVVVHSPQLSFGEFQVLARDGILPYGGTGIFSQTTSSPALEILAGVLNVRLDFTTQAALTAGPGYNAQRSIGATGDPALLSGGIGWPSNASQADTFTVPCAAVPGSQLTYDLTDIGWDGSGVVTASPSVVFELLGFIDLPIGLGSATLYSSDVNANAANFSTNLGEVQAELSPPVISAAGGGPGAEGSSIAFSATATDNCGTPSLEWQFSDGGTAFGPTPHHTFIDNGAYSGKVIATDAAGNTAQRTFSVAVSNVAPVVDGGPDKGSEWGLPVSFHANGTDAGAADRPWLQYRWDFVDPPTGGASGQDATHTFRAPGPYAVEVCLTDPQAAQTCDTVDVTIAKRGTTLGYTASYVGTATDSVLLAANLKDSQGAPVQGRLLTFTVGSFTGTALTNASGDAATSWPAATVGSNPVHVGFAGDGLYLASTSDHVITVGQESTRVAITSGSTSSPSKTVPVTVLLTDDEGNPVSGMTVAVALGSQGCTTGVTNASGVASCTVPKLTQKPGSYAFSATYAGNAVYLGSTQLKTFTISKR